MPSVSNHYLNFINESLVDTRKDVGQIKEMMGQIQRDLDDVLDKKFAKIESVESGHGIGYKERSKEVSLEELRESRDIELQDLRGTCLGSRTRGRIPCHRT